MPDLTVMASSPTVTDWLGSVSTAVTALVALVALIAAFGQVREARSARQQTRDLDRERSQPNVVMYFEPKKEVPEAFDLVIRNFGSTPARDVRMEIEPWPRRAAGREHPVNEQEDDRVNLPKVIRTLAPGQALRVFWDTSIARAESDLPSEHSARVIYEGIDGERRTSESYLDWRTFIDVSYVITKSIHDVGKSLDRMSKTMSKWSETPGGKLSVIARSGSARDRAERERMQKMFPRDEELRRPPGKRRSR